ncbi:MAG TPA: DUF4149 domain-containing protein [Planctomycetota bacterium]|nr:DUF4149 domain-containing protein [Planctomycetota bacterium]
MIRVARSVYFTALGLWVGGLATLGALVAPTVFQKAGSRAEAGRIFGAILGRFGWAQIVLAALVLVSAWILRSAPDMRWPRVRMVLVVLLCVLVVVSVFGVNPAVAQAAGKMGDLERVPLDDPGRVYFQSLHRWSERLAGATLLAGFALLVLSGASLKGGPVGA